MAEKATLARPYARAAFEFARTHDGLPRWSALLAATTQVVSDARVAPLLGSPHVTEDDLVTLLADAAGPEADDNARNFLRVLAHHGRLGLLPQIAAQYEALRAEAEHVADVELVAAMPVAASQMERLTNALAKRLGRKVRVTTRIDAALLGGAVVRAGDLVIDGSLRGRVARLGTALAE